jgi:hypothetical protein
MQTRRVRSQCGIFKGYGGGRVGTLVRKFRGAERGRVSRVVSLVVELNQRSEGAFLRLDELVAKKHL